MQPRKLVIVASPDPSTMLTLKQSTPILRHSILVGTLVQSAQQYRIYSASIKYLVFDPNTPTLPNRDDGSMETLMKFLLENFGTMPDWTRPYIIVDRTTSSEFEIERASIVTTLESYFNTPAL